MDIKLLRAVIEAFGTYKEYIAFLRRSMPCRRCEHERDCENQCGRDIWTKLTEK